MFGEKAIYKIEQIILCSPPPKKKKKFFVQITFLPRKIDPIVETILVSVALTLFFMA